MKTRISVAKIIINKQTMSDKENKPTFKPERVSKSKDKILPKEPFYQKFNRLYDDHERRIAKLRRAIDERNKVIQSMMSPSSKSRSKSRKSSRSNNRSSSRLIQSPAMIRQRKMEILQKVNKEEGVTFKPKINKIKQRGMVDYETIQ